MENNVRIGRMRKIFEAYEAICKPYCNEIGISVQAFEILLFIARNPGTTTAQSLCKSHNIKPTLMSFHIEKLVQAGYVERHEIDGNRRSIQLVCSEKATPVIKKGGELFARYTELLWQGISEEEKRQLFAVMAKLNANADNIIGGISE